MQVENQVTDESFEKWFEEFRKEDYPSPKDWIFAAYTAGRNQERFEIHNELDNLSVWCEAVQDHIVYCSQVDNSLALREFQICK